MANVYEKYIAIAKGRALEHDYPEVESHHCAVLVSGGRILSIGFNEFCNMDRRFNTERYKLNHKRPQNDMHAEMQAILQAAKTTNVRDAKLFVVRVNKKNELAQSSPCKLCRLEIPNYGISRVIYSISEFESGVWNVKRQQDKFFAGCSR